MGVVLNALAFAAVFAIWLFFAFTEYLDWRGRMEVIQSKHPRMWAFINARSFRLVLLILIFGLLVENAREKLTETSALFQWNESTGDVQAKRDIQNKLSELMKTGNAIRDDWLQKSLGKPEEQEKRAKEVRQWHAEVENGLRTIPRGTFYITRLNGATKTGCGGYPLGINYNACRELELLLADLGMLEEFTKDTDLGKP